jgi:hypothetical protein
VQQSPLTRVHQKGEAVSDEIRDESADRVSASVARALALVGPSERGAERAWDDRPAEESVS